MKTSLTAKIKGAIALKLLQKPVSRKQVDTFLKASEACSMTKLMLDMDQVNMYRMHRALLERCKEVQSSVLLDIVRANVDTRYGKEHHFSEIQTVEDFRREVPISEWRDYASSIEEMAKGASDILFEGTTQYFVRTTGTTGAVKLLPISQREIAPRMAAGKIKNMERAVACDVLPAFLDKRMKIINLIGTLSVGRTEGGLPIGSASGFSTQIEGKADNAEKMMAVPMNLFNYFDDEAYYHVAMRCGLYYRNVGALFSTNAKRLENMICYVLEHGEELIEEIRAGTCRYELPEDVREAMKEVLIPDPDRAEELHQMYLEGRLVPKYYWPELAVCFFWLSGSIGVYAEAVRQYMSEDVLFMDCGYGASEANINIPMEPETPSGALMIYGYFFEFLPRDGGAPLLAHELEAGKDYELLMTTNAGLYRYRIHDIIHVDGFYGTTPMIHFRTKAGDVANLSGEKLEGPLLLEMIRDAVADRFGIAALQIYPDMADSRYVVYIEPDREVEKEEGLSEQVDDYLLENISMYAWARGDALKKPDVRLMPRGWGKEVYGQYAKKGQEGAQIKVPVIRGEPWNPD